MEQLWRQLIEVIGEDPQREGLIRTPQRAAKSMLDLVSGYRVIPADVVNGAIFKEKYRGAVSVRDIRFFSLCEHHILPFFGRVHVSYIADGRILGLSKVARIVETYSRRLQVQERLTAEIAQALMDLLQPKGVACVVQAAHLCMMMRGVEQHNSETLSSVFLGCYETDTSLRKEFLESLKVPSTAPFACECGEALE
ncbi:MAG: GTP cyclohydrolase I FolE [Oligoflexia bacterium]|nr:GTP cyclohydrolase I FolE [Oligoflexia bacterium]